MFVLVCLSLGCHRSQQSEQTVSENRHPRINNTHALTEISQKESDRNAPTELKQIPILKTEVAISPSQRALIDELKYLDDQGLLTKDEMERIVGQFPQSGSITGIGEILCKLITSKHLQDRLDGITLLTATHRQWDAETDDSEALEKFSDENSEPNFTEPNISEEDFGLSSSPKENTASTLEAAVVMNVMTAALTDTEQCVRDAAFGALLSLPKDEQSALALQVLGNDDSKLKIELLSQFNDSIDDTNVTLNFHGLDAEEPDVRQLAAKNLNSMLGISFDSSEKAFEWWENQNQLFSHE